MGLRWDFISDEDAFIRRMQQEMRGAEIILEIERKINVPLLRSPSDTIKEEMKELLREFSLASSLQEVRQKAETLERELNEEKRRIQGGLETLDSRLFRVEMELKAAASPASPTEVSDARAAQQAHEIVELKGLLQRQTQMIDALKADIASLREEHRRDTGTSDEDALRRENLALKQQVDFQAQRMNQLAQQSAEQARALDEVRRQIALLARPTVPPSPADVPRPATVPPKLSQPQPAPSAIPVPPKSAPSAAPQTVPQSLPVKSRITAFALPQASGEVYFHGDGKAIKAKFAQGIAALEALSTEVARFPIAQDAARSFSKNLLRGKTALEKFYHRFDFEGYDAEELSEEVTRKFFGVIAENVLDNIVVGIYRGGQDAAGYAEFLKKVNDCLSKCGVYTREVLPGTAFSSSLAADIHPPIPKKTMDASKDGVIDEVELLPYFMDYEDEDGNREFVCKRGKIICLKYKG